MDSFKRLHPRLQTAIAQRLGWSSLRPVQELGIQAVLDGYQSLILAQTASGKTEAGVFPVLSSLLASEPEGLAVLYVAPTKALLNNQEPRLQQYSEMVGLSTFKWHGDVTQSAKRRFLDEPAPILMTTPESLEAMFLFQKGSPSFFQSLRFVIIDEIHAFAASERGAHLMSLLTRLSRLAAEEPLRIGLSATVGDPEQLLDWLKGGCSKAGRLVIAPTGAVRRQVSIVSNPGYRAIARSMHGQKALLFCEARYLAEELSNALQGNRVPVLPHHGSMSKEEREATEEFFVQNREGCIVSTSTLELGIDVGDLDRVYQWNVAPSVASTLQRMGRTGRRPGTAANTTFLIHDRDMLLRAVATVELIKKGWIEPIEPDRRCWAVLVHQVFALAIHHAGVLPQMVQDLVACSPSFAAIRPDEVERVLAHLLEAGWLEHAGARLIMSEKAERRFGKRNFLELCAVFSTVSEYTVLTEDGSEIGSLSSHFVDMVVSEGAPFLLAGRPWQITDYNVSRRILRVCPDTSGKPPRWQGGRGRFQSREMTEAIRLLLASNAMPPYLDDACASLLEKERVANGRFTSDTGRWEVTRHGVRWWTWAGGRINNTLRLGLMAAYGWEVSSSDEWLEIHASLSVSEIWALLAPMQQAEWWRAPTLHERFRALLPNARLSRFQECLPLDLQVEMLADAFTDRNGALDALSRFKARGRSNGRPLEISP